MRILGIDPGINITGYAILERFSRNRILLMEGGVIRGKSKETLSLRVHEIFTNLRDIILTFKPEVLALEEIYSHYARPKTAILMGHARGVICLAAAQAGIPVHSYSATTVKKTLTNSGHASKDQVQRAIQMQFSLSEIPSPPDVADAIAIALCDCFHRTEDFHTP